MLTSSQLEELQSFSEPISSLGSTRADMFRRAAAEMTPHPALVIETDVVFNGTSYCAPSLLGVPVREHAGQKVADFIELIKQLDQRGREAQQAGRRSSVAVFMSNKHKHLFMEAIGRIARLSCWQLEFKFSRIRPGQGTDIYVILPPRC